MELRIFFSFFLRCRVWYDSWKILKWDVLCERKGIVVPRILYNRIIVMRHYTNIPTQFSLTSLKKKIPSHLYQWDLF